VLQVIHVGTIIYNSLADNTKMNVCRNSEYKPLEKQHGYLVQPRPLVVLAGLKDFLPQRHHHPYSGVGGRAGALGQGRVPETLI
jgi:hypothetical protein